ncbi:hypothetical protein H0H93_011037 [Arthromyces matolae]|nr:hypothetical protein H0H93_011037 [Arthromyces matolae]
MVILLLASLAAPAPTKDATPPPMEVEKVLTRPNTPSEHRAHELTGNQETKQPEVPTRPNSPIDTYRKERMLTLIECLNAAEAVGWGPYENRMIVEVNDKLTHKLKESKPTLLIKFCYFNPSSTE